MIKTIKVKKQLRLDELIKHIFDNEIEDAKYYTSEIAPFGECEARVSGSGNIKLSGYINKNTTFTVEVEEEVTEDAPFEDMVILHISGISHLGRGAYHSIRSIRRDYPSVAEIHTLMNGKLQLIWEAK